MFFNFNQSPKRSKSLILDANLLSSGVVEFGKLYRPELCDFSSISIINERSETLTYLGLSIVSTAQRLGLNPIYLDVITGSVLWSHVHAEDATYDLASTGIDMSNFTVVPVYSDSFDLLFHEFEKVVDSKSCLFLVDSIRSLALLIQTYHPELDDKTIQLRIERFITRLEQLCSNNGLVVVLE